MFDDRNRHGSDGTTEETARRGRRRFLRAVGATAGAGATVALAGCQGQQRGSLEIVAGTAPGFPPFEIKREGELTGFDIELLEAVIAETDYTLERWEEFEFDSLIGALTSGNIDVIAAAMTITEERDGTIDFTDPYYNADQAVLVREGGEFSPGTLEDLSGRPVGAQSGTTGAGVIDDQLIAQGIISESMKKIYDSYVLAVEDLINGNIDAIVVDTPVANTFASNRPVEVAFTIRTGERYGFGVREDANDLTAALNDGLETVNDDGTYTDLRNKWFGG